jgi:hypothetical protein
VDQLKFDIQDLVRWRDRIFEAIHKNRVEMVRMQANQRQLNESLNKCSLLLWCVTLFCRASVFADFKNNNKLLLYHFNRKIQGNNYILNIITIL